MVIVNKVLSNISSLIQGCWTRPEQNRDKKGARLGEGRGGRSPPGGGHHHLRQRGRDTCPGDSPQVRHDMNLTTYSNNIYVYIPYLIRLKSCGLTQDISYGGLWMPMGNLNKVYRVLPLLFLLSQLRFLHITLYNSFTDEKVWMTWLLVAIISPVMAISSDVD